MITIFAMVLALVVIGFVGCPLLREQEERQRASGSDEVDEAGFGVEALEEALAALENDRELGKIGEEDYQELKDRYSLEAARLRELAARSKTAASRQGGKTARVDDKRQRSRAKR